MISNSMIFVISKNFEFFNFVIVLFNIFATNSCTFLIFKILKKPIFNYPTYSEALKIAALSASDQIDV